MGGRGSFPPPPPPKVPSVSPKRRVAREKERGREREKVGNVYYLGAMIIHVNSIPLNECQRRYYVAAPKTHKYILMVWRRGL